MNIIHRTSSALMIASLSVLFNIQSTTAGGSRITVKLRDGREVKGELLSAREKSLVVIKVKNVSDWELPDHPETISVISQMDIQKVIIKGKSRLLRGMGTGFLVGLLGGVVIAGSGAKTDEPLINLLVVPVMTAAVIGIFGLGGLVFGALIGGASSRGDETIEADRLQDLFYFRQYARFQDKEPEFLKTLGP